MDKLLERRRLVQLIGLAPLAISIAAVSGCAQDPAGMQVASRWRGRGSQHEDKDHGAKGNHHL